MICISFLEGSCVRHYTTNAPILVICNYYYVKFLKNTVQRDEKREKGGLGKEKEKKEREEMRDNRQAGDLGYVSCIYRENSL